MDPFVEHVLAATSEFRKGGEIVDEPPRGGVQVRHVYMMPHISDETAEGLEHYDLHFIIVGIDHEKAVAMRDEFLDWCRNYPEPERLAGGPSYIELGAVLGSQDLALRVMALGKALGEWDLITPATFGARGVEADMLAGRGMVMISGWKGG
jgi:hypothetical protein